MRSPFYDDPKYKAKQASITRKYWEIGTFDFKRKPLLTKYCLNPNCKEPFQVKPADSKIHCSKSCAISMTNRNRRKNLSICLTCNKITRTHYNKYCSNKCQAINRYRDYIRRWKQGLAKGNVGIKTKIIAPSLRRYLLEKYNKKCSICGWDQKHPITKVVPLEVNHIDGNADNNLEENLELLCPNCHSLTPNFRNLNKGNGRSWRK